MSLVAPYYCDKYHDQNHRGLFGITLYTTVYHCGKLRKNSRQAWGAGTEVEINYGEMLLSSLLPMACSAFFPITSKTTCPGMAIPASGKGSPISFTNQENVR